LISMIRRGELKPGESISHLTLAKRLGVSNNPVVHAFRRLEGRGILEHTPSGASRLRALGKRELRALFALRENIESLAARFCAEACTREEIAILQCRFDAMKERNLRGEWPIEEERSFHNGLVEFSHTPFLVHQYASIGLLEAIYSPVPVLPRPANVSELHEAIVVAIRNRDPDAAERAAHEHFAPRWKELLLLQASQPDEEESPGSRSELDSAILAGAAAVNAGAGKASHARAGL
jgi:DNA-binding GntR family transcriptional regulator